MAQTIKLKRSVITGQIPTVAQIELGELVINTFDGKIYFKKDDGTEQIVSLGDTKGDNTFEGANTFYGNINANADVTIGDSTADTFTVNATSDFNSAVNIDGNLTTTSNSTFGDGAGDTHTFNGNVDMNNNLNVDGNTTIGNAATDTLTVNADTTFNDDVSIANITANEVVYTNAAGDLDGSGNFTFDGTNVGISGTLDIDNMRFDGNTISTATGNLTINSAGTLEVLDVANFNSNVTIDGNTTIGNAATDTLTVQADATFNDDVSIAGIVANEVVFVNSSGDLDGSGNFTFDGTNADISGRLDVDNIRFDGNTISTTTGNLTIDTAGTLEVLDVANFNSNVTIDGNVDLGNATTDTITFNGSVDSAINPNTNNTRDLGTTTLKWRDIHGDRINGPVQSLATSTADPATQHDGTALAKGDIYYNTADDAIKTYDGTNWNAIGGGAVISDTEPTVKIPGMLWVDTINGGTYAWHDDSLTWIGVTSLGVK